VLDCDEPHAIVGLRRRENERAATKNGAVKVMPLVPKVVAEIRRWGAPKPEELLFPGARNASQPFAVSEWVVPAIRHSTVYQVRNTLIASTAEAIAPSTVPVAGSDALPVGGEWSVCVGSSAIRMFLLRSAHSIRNL